MTQVSGGVVVTGLGMHTSMGGIVQSAAGHRAGLSRAREIAEWPYFSEETREVEPISGHPSHGVSEGFQGRGRLLRLARNAFEDLWRSVNRKDISGERCGIVVVGPEVVVGRRTWLQDEDQKQQFGLQIARVAELYATLPAIVPYLEGKAGTAMAIEGAMTQLATGAWDHALVVALDSLLEWETLSALLAEQAIKTDSNPSGRVPGEAACVALLESPSTAAAAGRAALALLQAPSALVSENPEGGAPGEGLARVLLEATSRSQRSTSIGTLYSDQSGNPAQAVDLATALLRLHATTTLATWKYEIPAISFGDTGVAAGLLSTCLAVRAFERGYALGEVAAVSLSSGDSNHAAFVVERA